MKKYLPLLALLLLIGIGSASVVASKATIESEDVLYVSSTSGDLIEVDEADFDPLSDCPDGTGFPCTVKKEFYDGKRCSNWCERMVKKYKNYCRSGKTFKKVSCECEEIKKPNYAEIIFDCVD